MLFLCTADRCALSSELMPLVFQTRCNLHSSVRIPNARATPQKRAQRTARPRQSCPCFTAPIFVRIIRFSLPHRSAKKKRDSAWKYRMLVGSVTVPRVCCTVRSSIMDLPNQCMRRASSIAFQNASSRDTSHSRSNATAARKRAKNCATLPNLSRPSDRLRKSRKRSRSRSNGSESTATTGMLRAGSVFFPRVGGEGPAVAV
mmetsp:Transcript_28167/g.71448  ORF Transcript_28167/g.71448 Transcript_28167/m.71448 type:complete len:202 (+) Transcript_28167:1211-1816(+)